ncbi:hypothetical protein R1sor_027071 [Riccia sorocarpa]|uniref:Uncharacterized protein n=1 Tax=Riccia sorocarpa TaxID=122646 RepID=A0ABD3GDW3_9MARC
MSTLGTSLKGFGEGKRATERKHMEALLSEFTQCYDDWPCAKVAKFAQAVCGFSKDQADRLQREKIDLVTLADMSREEIVHVTNCAWGDARRLKKALETFVDKAAMFEQEALTCDSKKTLLLPTVPISKERLTEKSLLVPQSKSQQDCVSTVLPKPSFRAQNRTRGCLDGDQKLKKASRADSPTKISAGRSQLSGRSSAGSLRVPISYAPVSCALDPVLREDHTGRSLVERLSERVWAVKPKEEEPAQWGSDYVSEFHPGAKESYINVFRKLRKEFENLGEEVVIAAWRENFRYNRQAEQDTLRYIEKICLDLPSVPFIVSGAAVELRPDPLFILKNWFTTHKKHHRRRRLAEINNSVQSIALETQADDNPEKAHCTQVELPDVPDAGDEQCVFSPEKPRQRRVQEDHLSGQLNITSAPVSVTYGTDLGERVKIHAYSYSLIVEEDVICIDKQLRRSVEPLALRALHQKIIQFSIPIGVGVITEILQEVPYLMYEVKVESILSDYSLSTWYSWEAPFMQQMLRKGLRVRIPAVFLLIHDEEGLCDKSLAMFDESLGFRLYTPGRLDSSKVLDTTKIGTQSEKKTLDSPVAQPTVLALETQDHGGKPSGYTPEVHVQKQGVEEDESVPARSKRPVTRSSKGGLSGTLQTNLKQVKKRRQNQEKEMGCSEPRLSQFDEDGKLTIAMHAMKLRKKQDVFGTLAKFMAEKNKKHKENATTSKLPFVHHSGISSTGQLDLVVDWALQNKIDLVNLVSPENGVIRLYKHNIQFKEKKYE